MRLDETECVSEKTGAWPGFLFGVGPATPSTVSVDIE